MKLPAVLPENILNKISPEDRKSLGKAGLTREDCEKRAQVKNERELQRLIVGYLGTKGLEVLWHRTDKKSHATLGWPDLTFAAKGKAICWEVKWDKGKLSEAQELMAQRLKKNGWRFSVIRSFEQAKRELWQMCGL